MTLYCWDCGADMAPMPEIKTHARMLCIGCGLSSPREITERMNVSRASEIADMRHGTPCIVCGAAVQADNSGHDWPCPMMGGAWECAVCHAAPYIPCDQARHAGRCVAQVSTTDGHDMPCTLPAGHDGWHAGDDGGTVTWPNARAAIVGAS